jgi:hypothetical protein
METLATHVDSSSEEFRRNREAMLERLAEVETLHGPARAEARSRRPSRPRSEA